MDTLIPKNPKPPSWRPAEERPHPLIELRELVLLEFFEPPTSVKVLRRVTFRRGLNIIWADPKTVEARAGGVRTSGHSAGKSTLCRVLRWLLGESHFGPTEKEISISNQLPKGWALLHLNLDGQEWVVGRRFFDKSDCAAVTGISLQQVLATGWPSPAPAKPFFDEVKRLTIGSLIKKKFPGRDETIEPTHLLGWLSRDQEAAMQSLEAWRSSVGGPQERGPTKLERHLLMRMVLGLIESKEWSEMESCARLEAEKDKFKEKRPDLEAAATQACETLRRIITGDGDVLAGPLLIAQANKLAAEKRRQLEAINQSLAAHPAIMAKAVYEQAIRESERVLSEVNRSTRRAKRLEKKVAERSGELVTLKAKLTAAMRKPPPGYCARKKEEVGDKCPLYLEITEDVSAATVMAEFEHQCQALQEELEEERAELLDHEQKLPTLQVNEANLKIRADGLAVDRDNALKAAARMAAEIQADQAVLNPAEYHQSKLDDNVATVNDLSDQITASRQLQRELRKERMKLRLDFAEHYRSALAWLLGPEVHGGVEFDEDGAIKLSAENRASLSGPAIEAMKLIAFDLAAMFQSVAGRGAHPRLVIHDSPKVADIAPVPYSFVFRLAQEAEKHADEPTFQYIVTTTEPPPDDLQQSEHLRLRLDASTKEGRLFTIDF